MVWQVVPEHLTMTKEEAYRRYKYVNIFEQLVHSITGVNDKWGDPTSIKSPMKNGEVDCYIMKGAKKQVMRTYAWVNSHTDGGYVEAVVERYLRRKYPEEAKAFASEEDWDTKWDLKEVSTKAHRKEAFAIIRVMAERYYMHPRTRQSVENNFRIS